jgi:hypothetical protein
MPSTIESPRAKSWNVEDAVDIAAQLHGAAIVDQLNDAGCRLLAKELPILPINGKRPCNRSGRPARAWQRGKCDAKRLLRGLLGASDPRPDWKTKQTPVSAPGIGLRMGPGSVIDIEADSDDERAAIKDLFRDVQQPKTVSYESRRGTHSLYRYDGRLADLGKDVFKYRATDGTTVSIRIGGQKAGAQSVIPPTPGREWVPGCSFEDIEPAALPEVVIERLLEQANASEANSKKPRLRTSHESTTDELSNNDSATLLVVPPTPSDLMIPPCTHILPLLPPSPLVYPSTLASASSQLSVHVLETPYDNLNAESVQESIRDALIASVPTCYAKRHVCIFDFVRRLKAIPKLKYISRSWLESEPGRDWLNPILWEWFTRGTRFFNADFDECLADFLEGWDKVKYVWGEKLSAIYQESIGESLSAEVIKRLGIDDNDNNRRLLRLLAVLQRKAGEESFPLAARACGAVLGIRQQAISTKLKLFQEQRLGFLKRTFPGKRGRAAEYRYLAVTSSDQEESPPSYSRAA